MHGDNILLKNIDDIVDFLVCHIWIPATTDAVLIWFESQEDAETFLYRNLQNVTALEDMQYWTWADRTEVKPRLRL